MDSDHYLVAAKICMRKSNGMRKLHLEPKATHAILGVTKASIIQEHISRPKQSAAQDTIDSVIVNLGQLK